MLGLGAIVLVALVLPILTLGLLFFRMPFDEVAGIVAGACGNPAPNSPPSSPSPTGATAMVTLEPGLTRYGT
jgi:putative transport protein